METTKNDLPPDTKQFFYKLSEYLDTKLLYYGSVQRSDYVPGKSDIDIDIFTDNPDSLITKLQHFLHLKKKKVKKTMYIIDDKTIYGHKVKYENKGAQIKAEFAIYSEEDKEIVIKHHQMKTVLPIYISILLYILKTFYYRIPILTKSFYINSKNWLLDKVGNPNNKFIILEDQQQ
jgi:hypothetical protein